MASEPTLPRLSLVVLPCVSIGSNAEDDHFADGITETLTADLSRCFGVFAISRSTALAYKGKPIDTRQIGPRYVLEGSVQNAGERTRFNAQLVDAESGAHLRAEWFDKQRTNVLDMQDEVTTRLAHATKALALAPNNANAHVTYGTVLYAMCAPERALRESKLAIGLDGNLALEACLSRADEVFPRAVRRNPCPCRRSDPAQSARSVPLPMALFHRSCCIYLGRVVRGIESMRKSVEINPN